MRFAGNRAVVIGAGVAGAAAARVLLDEGADVLVSESSRDVPALAELRALGAEVRTGGHDRSHLAGADFVVASPGVPEHAPVFEWASERSVPVWSELELGARLASAPMIAVTGTNGKTTTTGMIGSILRAGGADAVECGNIGRSFPRAARESHDVLVVECSSFQLMFQESFHPVVSVLLNVAPDHLDWHGSFGAYRDAKARVFARQGPGDTHVANRDDPEAAAISRRAPCDVVWCTLGAPGTGEIGFEDGRLVSRWGDRRLIGAVDDSRAGYGSDAAAAAAASLAWGVAPEAVSHGLASYIPPPHRGEVVAEAAGVRFVDNSKATNVHAALAAIATEAGAVLIAGGLAKGVDLEPLRASADHLAGVVAIGESADEVVRVFEGTVPVTKAGSIEEATRTGFDLAAPGGVVLLAPACASWDMFVDYAERGDRFAQEARAIADRVQAR